MANKNVGSQADPKSNVFDQPEVVDHLVDLKLIEKAANPGGIKNRKS
jgi:hypothetical protein